MTATPTSTELLAATRWGECFSPEEIAAIAGYMDVRSYADNQSIFEQGDQDPFLAFIVSGNVDIAKEVADSLETIVVTLNAKTHFGELSLVDNEPRSASAIAKGAVTILALPRESFLKLLDEEPKLGIKIQQHLLTTISKRLRLTTRELIYRD